MYWYQIRAHQSPSAEIHFSCSSLCCLVYLLRCLSSYASQEGKSCKLIRVKNKHTLWLCLTSAEQLESAAIWVVKVLFQCELRTVRLPEPSQSGKGQVFPDRQENIYPTQRHRPKACPKACSETEEWCLVLLRFKPCEHCFLSRFVHNSLTWLSTMADNHNLSQLASSCLREPPASIYTGK